MQIKAPTPEPGRNYVCLMAHEDKSGSWAGGIRLRGDHPAVTANPAFWAPDHLLETDLRAIVMERFGVDGLQGFPFSGR